jgi:hypothetical protein
MSELREDPKNARRHGPKNLTAIKTSLEQLGQQKPIVVAIDGTIIAGNGTFRAAKELGWDKIGAVTFTGSARAAKQFALADNRTAELAEWDYEVLGDAFRELGEDAIGWEVHEREPLTQAAWAPPAPTGGDDGISGSLPGGGSDAPLPADGELFGAFTEAQASWILHAMQAARDASPDLILSNEEALARVCRTYAEVAGE